jgi:hypothetical protein
VFLIGRPEYWDAFGTMFKIAGNEKAYKAVEDSIIANPHYDLMQESGLNLTTRDGDLTLREEDFQTDLVKKVPVLKHGVNFSERAYVGFLNKLRADTFSSIINDLRKGGVDVDADPEIAKSLAAYINAATGRGPLNVRQLGITPQGSERAGLLEENLPLLNAGFFSPRLMASRVALLNPLFYKSLHPEVRKKTIRDLISFGGAAMTATTLASQMGFDVESDPRSSDFGKIRSGTKRQDILGGFGQYLTLRARS